MNNSEWNNILHSKSVADQGSIVVIFPEASDSIRIELRGSILFKRRKLGATQRSPISLSGQKLLLCNIFVSLSILFHSPGQLLGKILSLC